MKSIREAAPRSLAWKVAKDTYELRSGADLLATLRWQKGVSLYLGETAQGRWTFKRTGIFHPKLTLRREGESTDLATLGVSGSGGTLELSDGNKYAWTASRGEWSFKDATGELLIQMKSTGTPGNLAGDVVVSPAVFKLPEASLLILLGWYILVLQSKDVEASDAFVLVGVIGSM